MTKTMMKEQRSDDARTQQVAQSTQGERTEYHEQAEADRTPTQTEPEKQQGSIVPLGEDPTLRRIIQILRNGAAYQTTRFDAHSLLVRYLFLYWERRDADGFVRTMHDYFRQALFLIPQAASQEETGQLLDGLETAILVHEFYPVGRLLLASLNGI